MRRKLKGEFIGKHLRVVDSPNGSLIGLEGKIVDETKNTFIIDTGRRLLKHQITFIVDDVKIKGSGIRFRPHERIKKIR